MKRLPIEESNARHRERSRLGAASRVLQTKALIDSAKSAPCMDCGQAYPSYVMDFDHRDPPQKKYHVGEMKTCSDRLILKEIAKCDLVCANCHRERTYGSGRPALPRLVATG